MSTPPKRNRVIRVEDDLWTAALAASEARSENLSEEIRRFLQSYVERHPQQTSSHPEG